jgi:hypothetical protein
MSVVNKTLDWIRTRKSPVTAEMIAKRMFCHRSTAAEAIRILLASGQAKQVTVAVRNRYAVGIIINDNFKGTSGTKGDEPEGSSEVVAETDNTGQVGEGKAKKRTILILPSG